MKEATVFMAVLKTARVITKFKIGVCEVQINAKFWRVKMAGITLANRETGPRDIACLYPYGEHTYYCFIAEVLKGSESSLNNVNCFRNK